MPWFGGFKTTLNLLSKKKENEFNREKPSGEPICGAYRVSRDEFYYDEHVPAPLKKITPAMIQLPPSKEAIKPFKSTSDLTKSQVKSTNMHASIPNVFQELQNASNNNSMTKEQKKLDKQQKSEQRKQDKMAAQEQHRQEKVRREREKQELKLKAKSNKNKPTKKFENPPKENQTSEQPSIQQTSKQPFIQQTSTKKQTKNYKQSSTSKPSSTKKLSSNKKQSSTVQQPSIIQQASTQLQPQIPTPYSTNTLESSISRSSGPPPYSATDTETFDNPKNISFEKSTEDVSSWDMISQHRQQMNKQLTVKDFGKTGMGLQYNVGTSNTGGANSEA